jgi:hypothetical protein
MDDGTKPEVAAAPAPAEAPKIIWPIKVPLRKPVQAHGDMLNEMTFREPSGADIEAAGFPLTFDFNTEPPTPSLNEKKMAAMMSRLAAVPPSTIKALDYKDWSTCAWSLAGFFMPDIAM